MSASCLSGTAAAAAAVAAAAEVPFLPRNDPPLLDVGGEPLLEYEPP